MFVVTFNNLGSSEWTVLPDVDALRRFARQATPRPDRGEVHVSIDRRADPMSPLDAGVHTTLDAISGWDGRDGLPPPSPTAFARAEASSGVRNAFVRALKALLSRAVLEDVLETHQAAALARAAALATFGVGPAGRGRVSRGTAIAGDRAAAR